MSGATACPLAGLALRTVSVAYSLHLKDALDSVEFVSGPADSRWGAVRAAMGHPDPWALNYLAIGNEVRTIELICQQPLYPLVVDVQACAVLVALQHRRTSLPFCSACAVSVTYTPQGKH